MMFIEKFVGKKSILKTDSANIRKIALIFVIISSFFLFSCAEEDFTDFQENEYQDDTNLFELFDDQASLKQMWNSIDGKEASEYISDQNRQNKPALLGTLEAVVTLLEDSAKPVQGVMLDIQKILDMLIDIDPDIVYYYPNPDTDVSRFYDGTTASGYDTDFFAGIDAVSSGPGSLGRAVVAISGAATSYLVDEKDAGEMKDFMDEIIDKIQHPDFKQDFIDINETLSELLMKGHYPLYVRADDSIVENSNEIDTGSGHINTGLGNIVQGLHALITGATRIGSGKKLDRSKLYGLIMDIHNSIIDSKVDMYKALITNIETHLTRGGDVYENDADYKTDDTTIFSDAELGKSLKDTAANLLALMVREDREGALLHDETFTSKRYTLERLLEKLSDLGIDWENAGLEESLYDLLRHDIFGRDRVNDADAYAASHLETLLFTTAVTANLGFAHGGFTNEFGARSDVTAILGSAFTPGRYEEVNDYHGHGNAAEFSLNDALFSLTSKPTATLGTYELAFENEATFDRSNRNFRSIRPYSTTSNEHESYKFYFDMDFGVLRFLAGASTGDYGRDYTDGGGNRDTGAGATKNSYIPYSPDGIVKTDKGMSMMAWTTGWVARACFDGEGPYYYADPNADTETIDTKTYYKYLRPNGKTYAYVHKPDTSDSSTWDYIYPAEGDDPKDHIEYNTTVPISHAVLITNVNATYTVPAGHTMALEFNFDEADNVAVSFGGGIFGNEVTQADLLSEINDSPNHLIAYLMTTGQHNGYLKIYDDTTGSPFTFVNDCGMLVVTANNPAKRWILDPFPWLDMDELRIEKNAIKLDSAQTIHIVIDTTVDTDVTIDAGVWTIDEIITEIQNEIGTKYVGRSETGIIFIGESTTPGEAKILITNVGGGNGVETILGESSGTISKQMIDKNTRYNRYKPQWRTDFYLMKTGDGPNRYINPVDLTGNGSTQHPACLHYEEMIEEVDQKRACASPEEALYRNFQWVMTEKKMILIIPLYLREISPIGGEFIGQLEAAVFQVAEGNGFSGLTQCRIFRDNQIWAKADNTDDISTIPGDYRMDFRIASTEKINAVVDDMAIDLDMVYNRTMGRGASTPTIVGATIPSFYRLAFPRSPMVTVTEDDSGNPLNYLQDQLGSQDFEADSNDENWNQRNAIMPVFAALFDVLHEGSSTTDHALTTFGNGLNSLLMPHVFYNIASGNAVTAADTWLPRVSGDVTKTTYDTHNQPHADALVPDTEIIGFETLDTVAPENTTNTAYFGGWAVRDYYQPVSKPSILSFLIDTDADTTRSTFTADVTNDPIEPPFERADGLLSQLVAYDTESARSSSNEPNTQALSVVFDWLINYLMDSDNDDQGTINFAAADEDYVNWGNRRRVLYGIEQLASSMRGAKSNARTLTAGSLHGKSLPAWFFSEAGLRVVDIDADEMMDIVVGSDDTETDTSTVTPRTKYKHPNSIAVFPNFNGTGVDGEDNISQLREGEHLKHDGLEVSDTLDLVPLPSFSSDSSATDTWTDFVIWASERGGAADSSVELRYLVDYTNPQLSNGTGDDAGKVIVTFTLEDTTLSGIPLSDHIITCDYYFDRHPEYVAHATYGDKAAVNWDSMDDVIEDISDIFTKFVARSSNHSIIDKVFDSIDALMARQTLSDDQTEAIMYTLARMLARWDDPNADAWTYQGEDNFNDIYTILVSRIPEIYGILDDGTGEVFHNLLELTAMSMEPNGLAEFLVDTVSIPSHDWRRIVDDLSDFLGSDRFHDPDSVYLAKLTELLKDLIDAAKDTDIDAIRNMYEEYGFQNNSY